MPGTAADHFVVWDRRETWRCSCPFNSLACFLFKRSMELRWPGLTITEILLCGKQSDWLLSA